MTGVLISVEVSELFRSQTRALSLPVPAGGAGGAQRLPLHTEQTGLLLELTHAVPTPPAIVVGGA